MAEEIFFIFISYTNSNLGKQTLRSYWGQIIFSNDFYHTLYMGCYPPQPGASTKIHKKKLSEDYPVHFANCKAYTGSD